MDGYKNKASKYIIMMVCIIVVVTCSCMAKNENETLSVFENNLEEFRNIRGPESTVLTEIRIQINDNIGIYRQVGGTIASDSIEYKQQMTKFLLQYLGNSNTEVKVESKGILPCSWYGIKDTTSIKYLIGEEENGQLSLWEFQRFETKLGD